MTDPLARRLGLGQEILGGKNSGVGPYQSGMETPPQMPVYQCAHCDYTIVNGERGSFNGENLCYPVDESKMNCYDLVARKGHPMPCLPCYADRVTNTTLEARKE